MDDIEYTAEELIQGMSADEICELLEELEIVISLEQANAIQSLVEKTGSLEAALELFGGGSDSEQAAA